MDKNNKKLDITKLNDMVHVGDKILKILYALLIVVAIYVASLVLKEWNIVGGVLTVVRVISPLFIGWVLAWLLNPFVVKLTEKGLPRGISVVIVFVSLLLILYLIILALVPSLSIQINEIVSSIPTVLNRMKEWVDNIFLNISNASLVNLDAAKDEFFTYIENFGANLAVNLPGNMIKIIQGLISGMGTIAISFIVGFYMLFNFHNLRNQLLSLLPKKHRITIEPLIDEIAQSMHEFIKGTLLISIILFVVSLTGFAIIGLKAPVLFALFCAITNLIPYIGPYIGGGAVALIAFTQSSVIGIITIVFVFVVQLLESNILQPIVMSKKMNLHPVTIVVSLLIFGYFFGILGMVLATPIVALIKIIYSFFDKKYSFFKFEGKKIFKDKLAKETKE
ncbi:MAG: AI-2E family transporter [Bacilli bacterium]